MWQEQHLKSQWLGISKNNVRLDYKSQPCRTDIKKINCQYLQQNYYQKRKTGKEKASRNDTSPSKEEKKNRKKKDKLPSSQQKKWESKYAEVTFMYPKILALSG